MGRRCRMLGGTGQCAGGGASRLRKGASIASWRPRRRPQAGWEHLAGCCIVLSANPLRPSRWHTRGFRTMGLEGSQLWVHCLLVRCVTHAAAGLELLQQMSAAGPTTIGAADGAVSSGTRHSSSAGSRFEQHCQFLHPAGLLKGTTDEVTAISDQAAGVSSSEPSEMRRAGGTAVHLEEVVSIFNVVQPQPLTGPVQIPQHGASPHRCMHKCASAALMMIGRCTLANRAGACCTAPVTLRQLGTPCWVAIDGDGSSGPSE